MSLDEPQRLEKKVMRGNFTLQLKLSLFDEARQAAEAEGVSLNRLVNVAVGEKLSVLRTENYFAERAGRASVPKALYIRKRAGVGHPQARKYLIGSIARSFCRYAWETI
jgi:hypothetical protein